MTQTLIALYLMLLDINTEIMEFYLKEPYLETSRKKLNNLKILNNTKT